MKLKLESDIHVEFRVHEPNLEGIDVYVIAGDLGQYKSERNFLINLTDKYPDVDIVYVSGNHSFYMGNIESVERKLKELSEQYPKLHVLQNTSVVLHGYRFIGTCLWTDLDKGDPLAMYAVGEGLNDFKYIRYNNGQSRFTTYRALTLHKEAKKYVFKALEESEEPSIVVTHHCPYSLEQDKISNLWSGFQVDLDREFDECERLPKYWLSGHTHLSRDITFGYFNGEVRFISNQKGYPHEQDIGFYEDFVLDI